MFRLVLGTAGSGKSRYCLERITSLAKQGRDSVIIVPEQTGFTYEKELVERLPGTLGARTRVMSFRSISRHVLRECGGSSRTRMGEAQKTAFARRAAVRSRNILKCYSKSREFAFYNKLSSLFDELRSAGASPDEIRQIGETISNSMSREKFSDIAAIMGEYERAMGNGYLDEAGEILFASGKISGSELFKGKEVFLDAFSGFTSAETEMIRKIAETASTVTVALCCSGKKEDERSATAAAYKTSRMIFAISADIFGKAPEIISMDTADRFLSPGLQLAEKYFREFTVEKGGNTAGVCYMAASDYYDEAERVADEIVTLVRENDYYYKDIAVMFRSADMYREAVTRTFDLYGISYIFDEAEDMLSAPGTVFMLSAFEMSARVRTASLLRLLKTGLCDITAEEISLLEDYAFVHGTDGTEWFRKFDMNPSGFGFPQTDDQRSLLEKTESIREKVCGWLQPLYDHAPADGKDLVRECYELMERCGAAEAIERNDKAGRQNAEIMFSVIQQLYDLAEREELTKSELTDTLKILAAGTKSADIPRVGDGVFVGEAGRSRPFSPKVCFVMGLNDGVFPKDVSEGNLLTLEERDILGRNELILGGSFDQSTDLESYYLYDAVTSASEKLYLSYSESGGNGDMLPCAEIEGFIKAYDLMPLKKHAASGIVNERTARQAYAAAKSEGDEILVKSMLSSSAGGACREYDAAVEEKEIRIEDPALAASLIGDTSVVTASRMETFEQCRFMYFLEYLAGVRPLQKAELSPNEAGSFVHEVMELLMKEFSGDLAKADETTVRNACRRHADDYVRKIAGDKALTPRMRVISDQIKENCIRLAMRLKREQEQSRFRATGFELNIGEDIPSAVYETEDGTRAVIRGKIDRIDTFVSGDETYVRIVDYKTGGKDFNLSDVWQGLNVQMLLYLFAVKEKGAERYGREIQPAGVLYMPGDPSPASEEKKAEKVYTMKGLILNQPEVLKAMEEKGEGVFIPATMDPETGRWNADALATLEELGVIEKRIEYLVTEMVSGLRRGEIGAVPAEQRGGDRPCRYCPYKAVCRNDRITESRKIRNIPRAEMFGKGETDG